RTKWHKAVDSSGVTVPVWPVDAQQLPRWIEQRLRTRGLSATPDAIALLAERVQGNLLACAQEIEKLRLYAGSQQVDAETIANVVADSARFDAFALAEDALAGKTSACLRALAGLRGEGIEPPVILWVLAKELRTLYRCAEQIEQGQGIDRVLDGAGVWDRRKPLIRQALQRLPRTQLAHLLQAAQRIDAAIKGGAADNPWLLLDQLLIQMTTRNLHSLFLTSTRPRSYLTLYGTNGLQPLFIRVVSAKRCRFDFYQINNNQLTRASPYRTMTSALAPELGGAMGPLA